MTTTTTTLSAPLAGGRRKTPSELRQEQLNRAVRSRNSQDGKTGVSASQGSAEDQKKTGPRLVDTRVADIFAATKPHERPKFPFSKQKEDFNAAPLGGSSEATRALREQLIKKTGLVAMSTEKLLVSGSSLEIAHEGQATEVAPYNKFRDVTQLSSFARPEASGSAVDMAEALKVMAPGLGKGITGGAMSSFANVVKAPDLASPVIDISSNKSSTPPMDVSLKVAARFLSVDSLHWCHRTDSVNEAEGMKRFVEKLTWDDEEDVGCSADVIGEKQILGQFGTRFWQALHSWVHPPPQYQELYDIALATARGDTKKCTTMPTLYRMWEDSFQSLYYVFRQKRCNIFYFCTQQFVVMFVGGKSAGADADVSKAFWTRSTRGLRKILQEQGVEFSMPFCTSEADISTLEDLHELTELEKLNPGQTRLVDPKAAIDNGSQSLLAFEAGNVHRLFDFLLNYRSLVGSACTTDFPVLYSPVEFSKASLYIPEVKCKYLQQSTGTIPKEQSVVGSVLYMSYSLELKGPPGAYITPWVIQAVCRVLQKSQKHGFEVSFTTGPLSEALNVAQDILLDRDDRKDTASNNTHVPAEASKSKMSLVKHLRYVDGLYQATFVGLR